MLNSFRIYFHAFTAQTLQNVGKKLCNGFTYQEMFYHYRTSNVISLTGLNNMRKLQTSIQIKMAKTSTSNDWIGISFSPDITMDANDVYYGNGFDFNPISRSN